MLVTQINSSWKGKQKTVNQWSQDLNIKIVNSRICGGENEEGRMRNDGHGGGLGAWSAARPWPVAVPRARGSRPNPVVGIVLRQVLLVRHVAVLDRDGRVGMVSVFRPVRLRAVPQLNGRWTCTGNMLSQFFNWGVCCVKTFHSYDGYLNSNENLIIDYVCTFSATNSIFV